MTTLRPARTLTVAIEAPADAVYAYVADARHLPEWAHGLGSAPVPEGGGIWRMETPAGPVRVRFAPHNPFGVLDHVVTPVTGDWSVDVPFRVVPNGPGCEVLLTLFQQPGMSDAQLAADEALVRADLERLKRVMEAHTAGGAE